MNLVWIIAGAVVLVALVSVTRVLRRAVFGFALAATVLLALHLRHDPVEAASALAMMGGGLAVVGPLRRMLFRGLL